MSTDYLSDRRDNDNIWTGFFFKKTYHDDEGNLFEHGNAKYSSYCNGKLIGYATDLTGAEQLFLKHKGVTR